MDCPRIRISRLALSLLLLFGFCADYYAVALALQYQYGWRRFRRHAAIVTVLHDGSLPSSREASPLSLSEIKRELTDRGVSFTDCFDKESLVLRWKESQMTDTDGNSNPVSSPTTVLPTEARDSSSTNSRMDDDSTILSEVRTMTVRELREDLARRNQRWAGLLEKEDLIQAVYRARRSVAIFSATGAISPGEVGELTGPQVLAEITKTDTPLLLDAYAVWCGPCQMMAPQLVEAAKDLGTKVRVAKMDTDKHPEQASALKVQGLPTLILFRDGKEYDRIEGALMKDQLLTWIESRL